MKHLALSLSSIALLLAPFGALAEYETPGQLITAIQEQGARSFRTEAHGMSDGTYVSVWMNGSAQGSPEEMSTMTMDATMDVVHGDFNIRAKAEVLVAEEQLAVKVNSIKGSAANAFASLSVTGVQKQWFAMPFTEDLASEMTEGLTLDLSSIDASMADSMFLMQHAGSPSGNTYTLGLEPDAAAELGMRIRSLLGDSEPVSDDFFPWRALAEGMHFELIVKTDGADRFVSSAMTIGLAGTHSSFRASTSEKALPSGFSVSMPEGAVTAEELQTLMGVWFGMPMELESMPTDQSTEWWEENGDTTEEQMMEWPDASFDTVEPTEDEDLTGNDPVCTDPLLNPAIRLQLQRQGTCPAMQVKKADLYR